MGIKTLQAGGQTVFDVEYYYSGKNSRAGGNYPLHLHDKTEIYILMSGVSSFCVDGKIFSLKPYDALVIKPNCLHNCTLPKGSEDEHLCIWINADNNIFSPLFESDFPLFVRAASDEDKAKLSEIADYFAEKWDDKNIALNYCYAVSLLTTIMKCASLHVPDGAKEVPPLVAAILRDVNDHYDEIDSAECLARRHFTSVSTLSRLFSRYLFITPKAYIVTRKLAAARKFLSEGEEVAVVAARAGFSDSSNFIRLFKLRFGITPGEYKKKYRQY